jgi:hypothetical protein
MCLDGGDEDIRVMRPMHIDFVVDDDPVLCFLQFHRTELASALVVSPENANSGLLHHLLDTPASSRRVAGAPSSTICFTTLFERFTPVSGQLPSSFAPEVAGPHTHKRRRTKSISALLTKATRLLHGSEMTRWAKPDFSAWPKTCGISAKLDFDRDHSC